MKVHEQLHVVLNILLYGAHQNVHTGPQEHNHIQNTKKPSKQVQRNKHTFDWELGNRLADKYIIDSACQKFAAVHETDTGNDKDPDCGGSKITPNLSKFTFQLSKKENVQNVKVSYKWTTPSNKGVPMTELLLMVLINHFGDDIYDQTIIGFSELKHNNTLYRASAEYRNRGCWYDNALIAWVNKQSCSEQDPEADFVLIPSELNFFKLKEEPTLYCIVHSCKYTKNWNSVLSVKWKKEFLCRPNMMANKPIYHVITCDSIESHCLLLPYGSSSEFVLQILLPYVWADEFLPN